MYEMCMIKITLKCVLNNNFTKKIKLRQALQQNALLTRTVGISYASNSLKRAGWTWWKRSIILHTLNVLIINVIINTIKFYSAIVTGVRYSEVLGITSQAKVLFYNYEDNNKWISLFMNFFLHKNSINIVEKFRHFVLFSVLFF